MRHSFAVSLVVTAAIAWSSAGCQQPPDRAATASAPITAEPPAQPAQPAPEPTRERPPLMGTFDAISTTAMGITGDATLTATALTFSRGLTYETTMAGSLAASGDYAKGAGTWADLLGIGAETTVELRRVTEESVGAQAPNGGLCAPARTTFIALASAKDMSNMPALKMAAFKGTTTPGGDASASDLCGTFNYAPR